MARVSTPIFYRHIDQVVAKAELHITNPRNRSNRISSRHGTSNCQLRLRCDGGSLLSIWNRVFTNQTSYPCTRTDTPSRNRSSGSLCHFAYVTQQGCKVLPSEIASEAIAPCGTVQGPPGLSTIGNTRKRRWDVCSTQG